MASERTHVGAADKAPIAVSARTYPTVRALLALASPTSTVAERKDAFLALREEHPPLSVDEVAALACGLAAQAVAGCTVAAHADLMGERLDMEDGSIVDAGEEWPVLVGDVCEDTPRAGAPS